MSELTELLAEQAALKCALHALVHTVAEFEKPGAALTHFDALASGWTTKKASDDEKAQFRFHARNVRNVLSARLPTRSGVEINQP